ncbi:MAG: carbamoyltransferase [Elusimicrobiales bacterium]|nr:carbamoyltransferase [Elusimicrobiales bacterium]
MATKILGISAFYHDSAAALIVDGKVVFAMQEERATRRKHDPSFPVNAVQACLAQGGARLPGGGALSVDDLDAVAFYEKPLLKFERMLETYYAFAPRGAAQFTVSAPVWAREKLFMKRLLREGLAEAGPYDQARLKLLFPEHHLSHAASAFYPSPFSEAAIVTVDGAGEWACGSICRGSGAGIEMLREQRFPHSLGLLYSAITHYTGFKVNSGEYKVMGLAPYGDPSRAETLKRKLLAEAVELKADGSLWLNQEYFDYAAGLSMTRDGKWEALLGFARRLPETELGADYCDLALAGQRLAEEALVKLGAEARRLTGARDLCLAGGVALNCAANSALLRAGLFDRVWIQPAAGDAGGAVGAALAAHHIYFGRPRAVPEGADGMSGALLGPEFTDAQVEAMAASHGAVWEKVPDEALFGRTADLLASGRVVGWHQGRAEWGPRALGNRSILADARQPGMQERVNLKIKRREGFRPFAPSVTAERAADYFQPGPASPYMLLLGAVKEELRAPLPPDYEQLPPPRKVLVPRSSLPAVTHVDYTARLQTVHRETNPRYHALLEAFRLKTGCAVLLNTSFNVRGEPIVCSPEDSYKCFMGTGLDCLVIGNYIFDKAAQPAAKAEG